MAARLEEDRTGSAWRRRGSARYRDFACGSACYREGARLGYAERTARRGCTRGELGTCGADAGFGFGRAGGSGFGRAGGGSGFGFVRRLEAGAFAASVRLGCRRVRGSDLQTRSAGDAASTWRWISASGRDEFRLICLGSKRREGWLRLPVVLQTREWTASTRLRRARKLGRILARLCVWRG